MEYEFNNCLYPLGALWITFDSYTQKVQLKRCLWHNPFVELSIEEYEQINDIIEYALNFNYSEMTSKEGERDKCKKICNLPNIIKNVSVSISHACNLNCYHCYFDGDHKDSIGQKRVYFSTLEKLKGHKLDKILLTDNGEPFIYYDKILSYLKSLTKEDTLAIEITTNLMLLNEERIKKLHDTMIKTQISYRWILSLDGITKETFEATRIGASWEKVCKNVRLIAENFCRENIRISYVIRKPAIKDAPFAKSFFEKKFRLKTDIYYDFYDEECKEFFQNLKHLEYLS